MPHTRAFALAALLGFGLLSHGPIALGQEPYRIEAMDEAPPKDLADAIRGELQEKGYRITAGDKPFADVWLRKAVPAGSKPEGPKGAIQFPFLGEGELLGAMRYAAEGYDYRDQSILEGSYTLRYGLQPVNGDHLGVSPFRDYALLVPAELDEAAGPLEQEKLEKQSAEAAGTSHPAVLLLVTPPQGGDGQPTMHRDDERGNWGAVVPLPLKAPEADEPTGFPVQLIIEGAAAV